MSSLSISFKIQKRSNRLWLFAAFLLSLAPPGWTADSKPKSTSPPADTLPLTLGTNDPLDLFYADELTPSQPITLSIEATNPTDKAGAIHYEWKLTDYWGAIIRKDRFNGPSVAPDATDKWFLSFHRDADLKGRTGIYYFEITASKGKNKAIEKTAFGVIPHPATGLKERSMFGVASGVADSRTSLALQKIGARWLRTDAGINWASVEGQAKGIYDWDKFDRLASETRAHDVYLLPILGYAPDWAKPKDADGKPFQAIDAPANVQDHARFVAASVARYAKEIKYWETWNEPYVMGWTWHSTAQQFRDMMKADYDAAKKANPNAVVIASGGSASHLNDVVFIPGADMSAYVDETSSHTYGAGGPEDDFFGKAEHSVLLSKKAGKDRVWITEQGWTLGDSPKLAQYVPRTYALTAMAGASYLDWFTLADESMGLFHPDFTPRAAAVCYAIAAHFLEDTIFVRDLWPHSRRIYGAVFKNGAGRKVAVVWTVGDKGSLTLDKAKGIEAYDLMGGSVGRRDGDKLEIPLGEDVVYLTSDGDQAAFLDQVQNGRIAGITPVEIIMKPFLSPISQTPPIRAQVTNVLNRPIEGDLTADAPKGWKLAQDRVNFGPLEPGQASIVEFPVRQATISPTNAYPATLTAVSRHKGVQSLLIKISGPEWRVRRQQDLFLAGAAPGTASVDGDLGEWSDALPVTANTKAFLSPWVPEKWAAAWTPGNLSASFYTMYDDQNLYLAAKVTDNFHSATSVAENPYSFPWDGDSLQVALWSPEVMDTTKLKSPTGPNANRGLLCDTDYEFSFALTPKGIEVFRLHTPQSGYTTWYPTNPDVGLGLIKTVPFAAKRDDVNEITTYEAAIPWEELKDLPRDKPFHLAFKVNDRDRENAVEGWLESAAGAGEIRGNELSFSPTWQYTTANLSDWVLLKK
jgi:hypothetical protein